MAKIVRREGGDLLVQTLHGEVVVSDGLSFRTYYVPLPAPSNLKLALSLQGADISKVSETFVGGAEAFCATISHNGTRIALHCAKGERSRLECTLDEFFGIPETHWRKA